MKWNPFNTQIGLALGGGAAKGIAHVGVLKAIEKKGINVSCISGTSAGALVAAYYAFGIPVDKITSIGKNLNIRSIMNFTFKRLGLLDAKSLRAMIISDIGDVDIKEAKIPLAIVATDVNTGKQLVFREGSLADAVAASMALPGLFVPVQIGPHLLVDGGITENVPISPLEAMGAGIILAVDLNGVARYPYPENSLDVVVNAIDISIDQRTRSQLQKADIVISLDLSDYNRFDNTDRNEALFDEGYLGAERQLNRLNWYKLFNPIRYLIKVIQELIPLKIPLLIKSNWLRWHEFRDNEKEKRNLKQQ